MSCNLEAHGNWLPLAARAPYLRRPFLGKNIGIEGSSVHIHGSQCGGIPGLEASRPSPVEILTSIFLTRKDNTRGTLTTLFRAR